MRNWIFSTQYRDKDGKRHWLDLLSAAKIPITRYVKMRAEATPYDPKYHAYLSQRIARRKGKSQSPPNWQKTWWELFSKPIAESPKGA